MLTLNQGQFVVKLARQAILTMLKTGKQLLPPPEVDEPLRQLRGAFVSLHQITEKGERLLRGCIGVPLPIKSLVEAVIEASLGAAFKDPRFPSLKADELSRIVLEVSVLTSPQLVEVTDPIEYPSKIRVGVDGLLVESDWMRGLLLPQVATEHGFDSTTFLEQTCLKAGLEKDAWRKGNIRLYTFQAQIFSELQPEGEIVQVM